MTDLLDARRALADHAAWIDRSGRVRLHVTGPDRAKFLQNLTTNEVKRLPVGRGCEAFVTSPQGKTLGYGQVLALEDRILYRTDPGGLDAVTPHFQKYGLFDEVAWEDVSAGTFELHIAGDESPALLLRLGAEPPEDGDLRHRPTSVGDREVLLVRESPTGSIGFTLIGDVAAKGEVVGALLGAGRPPVALSPDAFEALRIEAGTPVVGRDVTPDNLPQEIGRDDRAISFIKGCYLGQETVARIDALGHVNKILKGLRIESPGEAPRGTALLADGKPVGAITSSAHAGPGRIVALAMIRTAKAQAGTKLAIAGDGPPRAGVVCDLPMVAAHP